MDNKVLIIEDDEYNQALYGEVLSGKRCELFFAEDEVQGLAQYQQIRPDLIILDLEFGGKEWGLDLFSRIREIDSSVEVIVISVVKDVNAKLQALKLGVYDYIEKPITRETLSIIVDRVFGKIDLLRELKRLQSQDVKVSHGNIITRSPNLLGILKKAEKVAETDATILLTGEEGTETEEIASFIHSKSYRKTGPFTPVDCATIYDESIGGKLEKMGGIASVLQETDGGTIFLDEIGRLGLDSQTKLLRSLQAKEVKMEMNSKSHFNVRVIAGTSEALEILVQQQRFLRSLYYRLAVVTLAVPPLRNRLEDILLLSNYFLEQYSRKHRKMIVGFDKNALDFLLTRKWPGNVRELENLIESAVIFSSGRYLSAKDFQWNNEQVFFEECNLDRHYEMAELKCITTALALADGEISRATKLVGLKDNRKKFYDLLKKHRIDISEYKK